MDNHSFRYAWNLLVNTDFGHNLRSRARFRGLNEVRLVEYLKVLLMINNNGLPSWLLRFFIRGYNLFLSLNNVNNLLNDQLNLMGP